MKFIFAKKEKRDAGHRPRIYAEMHPDGILVEEACTTEQAVKMTAALLAESAKAQIDDLDGTLSAEKIELLVLATFMTEFRERLTAALKRGKELSD